MELATFAANALAAFNKRHAESDSLVFNSAGFSWNGKGWDVEVRGFIVFTGKKFSAIRDFVTAHNNRLAEGMNA